MDTTPPAADVFDSAAGATPPPPLATTEAYSEGPTIAVPSAPASSTTRNHTLDPADHAARLEYVAFLGEGIPKA
eukprot:12910437-Prorocentrum_lima.AAC.1